MRAAGCGMAAVGLAMLAAGCASQEDIAFGERDVVSRATSVGAAPMFAVSPSGEEAIAWVSAPDGGTDGRLYIAVGGREPVELRDPLGPIEAHGEAPPKLAYGADGALNAIYVVPKLVPGRRFPASALRFIRSTDGGATWSEPVSVTDDEEFGSHNFHALHAAADGALYVSWLDGRSGRSAAWMTRSVDGGRTWEPNRRAHQGEACPCCRTAMASAQDGTLYLAWRGVLAGGVRDIVVARSNDGGATWAEPVLAHDDGWVFDACPHAGPALQVDAQGRVHIAWWTGKEGSAGVYYARSDDGGRSFGEPVALGVAQRSQPAHVQLALDTTGRVVVTWDDGTRRVPAIVVRVSRDGGETFGDAVELSREGVSAGYPVLALAGDGITVAWTERVEDGGHDRHAGGAAGAEHAHAAAGAGGAAGTKVAQGAERVDSATVAEGAREPDPSAPMGLKAVGNAQVVVRRGILR